MVRWNSSKLSCANNANLGGQICQYNVPHNRQYVDLCVTKVSKIVLPLDILKQLSVSIGILCVGINSLINKKQISEFPLGAMKNYDDFAQSRLSPMYV